MEMCSPEKQRVMGQNGKNWVSQYAFEVVQGNFEDHLRKIVFSSQRQSGVHYQLHEK
jgi:hypothetical protein